MKIHIVTVGAPKLEYAKAGWQEYITRLQHYHQVRITHISDKNNDDVHFLSASKSGGNVHVVALTIDGPQYDSEQLAEFLEKRARQAQELCLLIGGPDGLSKKVIESSNQQLGLSALTFPHDLAMVIIAEALYRASTINSNQPYHR